MTLLALGLAACASNTVHVVSSPPRTYAMRIRLALTTPRAMAQERSCSDVHVRGTPNYIACVAQSDDAVIDDGKTCTDPTEACFCVVARVKQHGDDDEPIDIAEVTEASLAFLDLVTRKAK